MSSLFQVDVSDIPIRATKTSTPTTPSKGLMIYMKDDEKTGTKKSQTR